MGKCHNRTRLYITESQSTSMFARNKDRRNKQRTKTLETVNHTAAHSSHTGLDSEQTSHLYNLNHNTPKTEPLWAQVNWSHSAVTNSENQSGLCQANRCMNEYSSIQWERRARDTSSPQRERERDQKPLTEALSHSNWHSVHIWAVFSTNNYVTDPKRSDKTKQFLTF